MDYTYRWYKDGAAIDGATEAVLTLAGNVADAGTYKVEVTATLKDGTNIVVTSDSATGSKEQKVKILHAANTISYDANGGEGGPSSNYTGGTEITVQTGEPTREGYAFDGWNTKADGTGESYREGATYAFANDNGNGGCNVTLYAQWIKAYDIYVGGVQIIETNKNDVLGDGKVSYDVPTNTLTLHDAEISTGYEYKEDCVVGIYAAGDLNIELIGTDNIVVAPDSKKTSYGIRVLGDLNISGDGTVTADGGEVTAQDTTAKSVGIFTDGVLYIANANVNANGGNVVISGEGTAYSGGVYSDGGLVVALEGSLIAKGSKAQGVDAYSSGIEAIGSEENYINVSVYDGYLIAEGGEAVGTNYAGSTGIQIGYGGLYLYETKANAVVSAGKAAVTSGDQEQAYAYSNGIYIFAGDVDIAAGKLVVSSDSYVGINGDAYAVYVRSLESVDDDGNPYRVGGNFTVECDEVKPGPYTPNLVGTTVIINSQNDKAIHADSGIDISSKLFISLPENGKVNGVGRSDDPETWTEPYYWTITDLDGSVSQNVIIKPLSYSVSIKGLRSYDMAVVVPAGESVNDTYCELYGVNDFSEKLNPKKEGFTFGGFYMDEACTEGNEYSFNTAVSADITIYAKWEPVEEDDGNDSSDDTQTGNDSSDDTQTDNDSSNNTQTDNDTEENNKPDDSTQNETDNSEEDNTISDTSSPQTGDTSNLWLWVALLFVSGGAVITLTVVDRKNRSAAKR